MMHICKTIITGMTGIAISLLIHTGANASEPNGFKVAVGPGGSIHMPDVDFRRDWVALGSWAIDAEESAGSKGMHVVYSQRATVNAYRKTGAFPDGAVLIKELLTTTTEDMTTGTISRAKATTGWFVMIKDSKGRFPNNPLWGDGWGWAYFDVGKTKKTVTKDYNEECLGCHIPAQSRDWVYTEGYPVLTRR